MLLTRVTRQTNKTARSKTACCFPLMLGIQTTQVCICKLKVALYIFLQSTAFVLQPLMGGRTG